MTQFFLREQNAYYYMEQNSFEANKNIINMYNEIAKVVDFGIFVNVLEN